MLFTLSVCVLHQSGEYINTEYSNFDTTNKVRLVFIGLKKQH